MKINNIANMKNGLPGKLLKITAYGAVGASLAALWVRSRAHQEWLTDLSAENCNMIHCLVSLTTQVDAQTQPEAAARIHFVDEDGRDCTTLYGEPVPFLPGTTKLPMKTNLPDSLKDKLKTRYQWENEGMRVKEGAHGILLIPGPKMPKYLTYYHESEVEDKSESPV